MNARNVTPRSLGELLNAICEFLRRFVVFQHPEQAEVCALWIVHTWFFEKFDYTPYLHIYSAEKRSGKTRLLDCLSLLVKEPWRAVSPSEAVLFRRVDRIKPTLLLDEIDAIFSSNQASDRTEHIRALLNAGFENGAKVPRCVGKSADLKDQDFSVYCPKALSGIGRVLHDTVDDRCLKIELRRQLREERIERFRKRKVEPLVAGIRVELEALAQQPELSNALSNAQPALPDELGDRAQDITEPLLALADIADGEWPARAWAAVIKLCAKEEDSSLGIKLLADIKTIFDSTGADKLPTEEILEALVAIEDRPWAFMFDEALKHNNLRIAAAKLSAKLKGYKTPGGEAIKSRTIKLANGDTAKGYHRSDFLEEWRRYLTLPKINVTNVTNVTHERKTDDIESQGYVESDVTGQDNVTDLPSKVTTVTMVTSLQREQKEASWGEQEARQMKADELWQKILAKIPAKGFLRSLAETIRPIGIDGHKFWLGYSPENRKKVEVLASVSNRRQLERLLREASGRDWSLEICSDPIRGNTGICLHELAKRDFPRKFTALSEPI
jgi:hypothetical protein